MERDACVFRERLSGPAREVGASASEFHARGEVAARRLGEKNILADADVHLRTRVSEPRRVSETRARFFFFLSRD
jgi:hypothetical protein